MIRKTSKGKIFNAQSGEISSETVKKSLTKLKQDPKVPRDAFVPGTPSFKKDGGDKDTKESKVFAPLGLFDGNFKTKENKNDQEEAPKSNLFSNLTAATLEHK